MDKPAIYVQDFAVPNSIADLVLPFLERQEADGFLFSGTISRSSADQMVQVIENQADRRKNAFVFLTTGGGDPNAAYRVGRALRRNYSDGKLSFFLGGYCKSAGTLLVLCADELIFSTFGELGPLDVQIGKPNELMGADSGLDLTQALKQLAETAFESFEAQLVQIVERSGGAISTKLAAEIATALTIGIMSPIAGQVDPLRLGYSWRANQIGVHYGELLAGKNVKADTVHKLVNGYPAHEVVIDEAEARHLFKDVRHSNDKEGTIFEALHFLLRVPVDAPLIINFRTDLRATAEDESLSAAPESINGEENEDTSGSRVGRSKKPASTNGRQEDLRGASEGKET